MAEERYGEFKTNCHEKVRVKKEEDDSSLQAGHSHMFKVKFDNNRQTEYTISCNQPRTVLEAVKSKRKYSELKWADENIIIQLGEGDKEFIVATHFPCSCIKDGETLIISAEKLGVENPGGQKPEIIHPRNRYSVFNIDREGGKNTKKKVLFRNSAVKQYKYLCVYGENGMTVEEALKRDGRFIDDLGDFTLSHNDNPIVHTDHTDTVDILDQKKFKLCLPLQKRVERKTSHKRSPQATKKSQCKTDRVPSLGEAQQSGESVITAVEKGGSDNTAEIYKLLREQCPALKKWMESRFPGDSFQEQMKLSKENFGKIQASFSEVHRVRKLLELGESVCTVIGSGICQGTGFVLFDNVVLTNAHLFTLCGFPSDMWMEQLNDTVTAVFNCEDPGDHENWKSFKVVKILYLTHGELDYAILELDLDPTSQNKKIPPGILNRFAPMPQNGEACLIGHPNGEVKKMDPTCIIGKQNREQNVEDQLHPFITHKIINTLKEQDIEGILIGGNKADKLTTYNTFMLHGSSGSPVFDGYGKVFGLHTGGFVYEYEKSVIEYAQPLLTIFNNFVSKLKERGHEDLLKRVKEEANGNKHLQNNLWTGRGQEC
ncbi:serine protease FAM111A-like [Channa argus]|uniref:serine protease FAM111A-like n=1 Tax=Channa argus TaxID=215402 RepID=UPI002947AE28|nr:hypothetical protein Q8A73_012643 [Channa argus]